MSSSGSLPSHSIKITIEGVPIAKNFTYNTDSSSGGTTTTSYLQKLKVFEAGVPTGVSCVSHGPCWGDDDDDGGKATISFGTYLCQLFVNEDVERFVPESSSGGNGGSSSGSASPPVIKTIGGVRHVLVNYDDVFIWDSITSLFLIANYATHGVSVNATARTKCLMESSSGGSSCSNHCYTCYSSDTATAYRTTISALEKPWGSSEGSSSGSNGWESVTSGTRKFDEDEDGKDLRRPWFHMWAVNRNAIKATIAPSDLNKWEEETEFAFIPTEELDDESLNKPATAYEEATKPKWKEILSDEDGTPPYGSIVGAYVVEPIIKFDGLVLDEDGEPVEENGTLVLVPVALAGKKGIADVIINHFDEVQWVPKTESKTITEDGETLHLAELSAGNTSSEYMFTNIENTFAVFPTFSSGSSGSSGYSGQSLNQARVTVVLTVPLLTEMHDTVHLHWFDPINVPKRSTDKWSSKNPAAGEKNDNIIGLSFVGQEQNGSLILAFNNNVIGNKTYPQIRNAIVNFSEGLGDNFIVAVHPNAGVVEKYIFVDDQSYNSSNYVGTIGATLLCPKPSSLFGSYSLLPNCMYTKILYNAAWNGFKVPETWILKEVGGTIHIETETRDTIEVAERSNGESYAKSVLRKKFENDIDKKLTKMELRLEYHFDRSRDNVGAILRDGNPPTKCGYVLAKRLPFPAPPQLPSLQAPKISFVGNSGVKIGDPGGYNNGNGPHEIQIIDMEALIAMGGMTTTKVGDINEFKFFDPKTVDPNSNDPTTGVHDDGKVSGMTAHVSNPPPGQLNPLKFGPIPKPPAIPGEDVSTLMHGVAYGRAYTNMQDYNDALDKVDPNNPAPGKPWEKYWHTLKNNFTACSGSHFTMVIEWIPSFTYVPAVGQLTVNIQKPGGNKEERYSEDFDDSKFKDGHIYLQSHWGSGVVFTSANFSPDIEVI